MARTVSENQICCHRTSRAGTKGQGQAAHMDEAGFSGDATVKQQEDSPYDGGFSQTKPYSGRNFSSKNDILDVSDHMTPTVEDPQGKSAHGEPCRHTDPALPLGNTTEGAVREKDGKGQQCTPNLHVPAKANIPDVLQHHLSEEEFLKGQSINCDTVPEISSADCLNEAIVKNILLPYVKSSWPQEQTPELSDQPNPKRDDGSGSKPSCPPATTEESAPELEEPVAAGDGSLPESSNFLSKTKSPRHKPKGCQGQTWQKLQPEKTRSGHGFKYDQIHYQFSDFSTVAPQVKIPKNNIIDKPLPVDKQASFPPELRDRLALVQDVLGSVSGSHCVERAERNRKTAEPSQQTESVAPVRLVLTRATDVLTRPQWSLPSWSLWSSLHVPQIVPDMIGLTANVPDTVLGTESERSLCKLSATSQKDPSSSSSYIFQKISQGKKMCQKLKEQTDQLKTKVQEFSKSVAQDSPCHVQDKRLVLEKLQAHFELLEHEFVANKEKHLTLKQQAHKYESPAASDFDPERKVEGEILTLEMLLEDVREKIVEGKHASAGPLPMSSPSIRDGWPCTSSPPSEEGKHGEERLQEDRLWKFPIALHEKALHPDSLITQYLCEASRLNGMPLQNLLPSVKPDIQGPDRGLCCLLPASGVGLQSRDGEACSTRGPNSPADCHHEPLKEFHYRYNTPGQNYLNHTEESPFIQLCFLNENKNSSPSCSKPNWTYFQRANSKSSQEEHEPLPGKNLTSPRTSSPDLATSSPHFHSCRTSGSKFFTNVSSVKETKSEGLDLSLVHALKTATVLRETTDQMIRTIAEDLAKLQRWRNRLKY